MGLFDIFKKKVNNQINIKVSTEITTNTNNPLDIDVDDIIKEDYRIAIFLFAESYATKVKKRNEYVGYLNYECGITNPDLYHKKLIDEGYYQKAKAEELLKQYKVSELKEILSNNNLSTKGKKDELISSIVLNVKDIENIISSKEYYSLSDKGKKFLEDNDNYVCLHKYKDYQISLLDYYNATKNDKYKRKFNDIAWQIFNERTLLFQKREEYMSARYNFFNMANLLMREQKYKQALQLYLDCLIIDLSGIESRDAIRSFKSGWCTKKEFLERLEFNNLIHSLINQIVELKEYYDESMLFNSYEKIYLPFNVSSREFAQRLLNEAFTTPIFDLKKIEKELIDNKKKYYLKMI